MESSTSTRLWLAYREAGRPFPKLSDDDVLDFLGVEAIRLKIGEEQRAGQDAKEREDWRKAHKGMTAEDLAREAKARA